MSAQLAETIAPGYVLQRGEAPLLLSMPHPGSGLAGLEPRFESAWLARVDCDWWLPQLYAFAGKLGATLLHTTLSRSVIDLNRDPSGASLYPGQATTGLVPTETFDGVPLYREGQMPDGAEIDERRRLYFEPYHALLRAELQRLRARHPRVVLYDCHSIRSRVPRLFDGELPLYNLGSNSGASADAALIDAVRATLQADGRPFVVDGRFKGGWITRHYGRPADGVHALQMELACRGYMDEPSTLTEQDWPTPLDAARAAPTQATLERVLRAALHWAAGPADRDDDRGPGAG